MPVAVTKYVVENLGWGGLVLLTDHDRPVGGGLDSGLRLPLLMRGVHRRRA